MGIGGGWKRQAMVFCEGLDLGGGTDVLGEGQGRMRG